MNQSIANPMIANPGGAMMQGMQYGTQVQDMRRQNALRSVLQEVGPAIAAGDTNALARVYEVAPDVALELQRDMEVRQREATRFDRESANFERQGVVNSRQDAEWEWQVKDRAAAMSAAERAAEAAQIEKGLSGAAFFYQNGDKAGYDGFLKQNGLDPASLPFEQFPALAAQFGKALDILRGFEEAAAGPDPMDALNLQHQELENKKLLNELNNPKPGFRAATPEELAQYGAQAGQVGPDGRFYRQDPPRGMTFQSDGAGGFILTQGAGVGQNGEMSVGDVYNPGEVTSTIALIDEIAKDPNLNRVVGPLEGGGGNDIEQLSAAQRLYYGQGGLSVIEKINQLQSRSWLAARKMLKGGGPITDYESRKAEAAVARLSRAKGEKEYREALTDLRDAITEGMAKLEAARGGTTAPQPAPPPAAPQPAPQPAPPPAAPPTASPPPPADASGYSSKPPLTTDQILSMTPQELVDYYK